MMMLSLEGYHEALGERPNMQSFSLYLPYTSLSSKFYTHSKQDEAHSSRLIDSQQDDFVNER